MNKRFKTLDLSYSKDLDLWRFSREGTCLWTIAGPEAEFADGRRRKFSEFSEVSEEDFSRGRGEGLTVRFRPRAESGLPQDEAYCFRIWQPLGEEGFLAEWWTEKPGEKTIAAEDGAKGKAGAQTLSRLYWPRPESISGADTVLPWEQGQLIPCDWPEEVTKPAFDGQFCTAGAYMPWIGQSNKAGMAWQLIAETPWDGGYAFCHPAGGPTSDLAFYWLPSLGAWRYPRRARLYFLAPGLNFFGREADPEPNYNHLAKRYRRYVKERGLFTSLAEKMVRNPHIRDLVGAAVVHLGTQTHVEPDSRFYKPEHPEQNDVLVTFAERRLQMEKIAALGAPKLYLHLDGWGAFGYDNRHPDYLPISAEAGGPAELSALAESVQKQGNLFGLHDQYRDYYFRAESFNRDEAVTKADGSNPEHANWAGGRQSYLCSGLAEHYLRRNFSELFKAGIRPDCSYLDVFTCNEPDECFHAEHPMSRRGSLEARLECFAFLNSQGIIPSSEEMNEWALRELVFCHYAPHAFMLSRPGSPRPGRAIPLWNLVFHDAAMSPWLCDPADENHEDYLLYALLNAGMPYLFRDGAYPGIDGAFGNKGDAREKLLEDICRADIACRLQKRLAETELLEHRFLSEDGSRQQCLYADGTRVEVNFADGSFKIEPELEGAAD